MTFKPSSVQSSLLALVLVLPSLAVASDVPSQPSDWLPAGVEQLAKTAEFHTDFTFDRTMLQMASGLVDGGDMDTRRAIAKLNGITVHLYKYAAPGMYDPRQLDVIRQQYKDAGWKHLVNTDSHPNAGPAAGSVPYSTAPGGPVLNSLNAEGHTDLYLKFQGADVVGMVLVQASPRTLNVVALNGDLSPLDLLHLRGHFGIPKFAGDGFSPADN